MSLYQCLVRSGTRNYMICVRCWSSHATVATKDPTAGIIVIGDEILKAQVRDANSYYMCNLLYRCGIKVKKISVIGDNTEEIYKEIKDASRKFTYVMTSGGIGPTHDDVTYEALAKAFDDTLHYHPRLVDVIRNHFGIKDVSFPAYKMAHIPRKASLKFSTNISTGKSNPYPYIVLENVYVFPGSPVFFERSFQSLYKDLLSVTEKRFIKDEVFINTKEEGFANALSMVVKEFPNVSFGSYPVSNCRYFKAYVTIESDNKGDTKRAKRRFCELIPTGVVVHFDRTPHVDCVAKYDNFLQNCPHRSIHEESIEKLRQLYQDPEHVAICIDGDMESSIIIHLAHICKTQSCLNDKLQAVYFKEREMSLDIEEFVKEMTDKYNLMVYTVEAESDKSVEELMSVRAHLRTLLIGKTGEESEKEINRKYASASNASNAKRLQIDNPLHKWTNEDVRFFASSLCLPYVLTA